MISIGTGIQGISLVIGIVLASKPIFAQEAEKSATKVSSRLIQALEGDSVPIKSAALSLLMKYRCDSAMHVVRSIAMDPATSVSVRRLSLMVLSYRTGSDACAIYQAALMGENEDVRCDAAMYLSGCSDETARRALVDGLRSELNSVRFRLACAMSLSSAGSIKASKEFFDFMSAIFKQSAVDNGLILDLSKCLSLLTNKRHISCLSPMLKSSAPSVKARAEIAWVRLGGSKSSITKDSRYRDLLLSDAHSSARRKKQGDSLQELGWRRSTWQEFLEEMKRVRLVACGEAHFPDPSVVRNIQRQLVDAMVRGNAADLRVGYEPSVLHVQRGVVEYASHRGFEEMAMERHWKLNTFLRVFDPRDLDCAKRANKWLSGNENNRLLLLRGQAHLHPKGLLLSKIKAPSIILFTDTIDLGIPLELMADSLHAPGLVLRSKGYSNVWFISCDELGRSPIGNRRDLNGEKLLRLLHPK